MQNYAKIIVYDSPITKSNFKLHNTNGRAILPNNSGKYNDRYALYEEKIAYTARLQNPGIELSESLIAILKVYYKSHKRHPDTINITKSIFDGVEKSGLIVNDAQIRRILTEEYYDKENPRFELELFGESSYSISYSISEKEIEDEKILYKSLRKTMKNNISEKPIVTEVTPNNLCDICKKALIPNDFISCNNGKTFICKKCFHKLF